MECVETAILDSRANVIQDTLVQHVKRVGSTETSFLFHHFDSMVDSYDYQAIQN